MNTFRDANQVRLAMKMKLSQYSWFLSSLVIYENDGCTVILTVKQINNLVRKIIPPVLNGINIKTIAE